MTESVNVLDGDFIPDRSERAVTIMNKEAGSSVYTARPLNPIRKRVIHVPADEGDEAFRILHRAAWHKGMRKGDVGIYQHPDGQSFCVVG